jgi:cell division transport system ATP-binding protein
MSATAIINLQDVNLFQNKNHILQNVNMQIDRGEMVYLIGKTGSGKSTLIRSLYADVSIHSGNAVVLGHNIATIKDKEIPQLRRKIGVVFQDFQLLFDRTIYQNLRFVLRATAWKDKNKIDKRIQEVLDLVNMPNVAQKMPHELSGGEQQRVAIARALLNSPELIIADEPTGNLDPATSVELMELFQKINQENNVTILMATHDYALILKFPSKTLRCENKKIEEISVKKRA